MAMRKIVIKSKKEDKDNEPCEIGSMSDRFPRFRIDLKHLPEAKKWEVGKEYTVTLKLKMTGISISKFQNDSEYDVIGIDVQNQK